MARTKGSHAETTARSIRASAQHLFARHGYAAVSMRQIAAEVGVQVGALYSYTADKEALLMDLLRVQMDAFLAHWPDPQGSPAERLDRFVDHHVRLCITDSEGVFLSYMELRNLSPENRAEIAALRRRYEDGLQALLEEGRAQGVMTVAEPRLAAMALISMLAGVTTWYRRGGPLDPAGVVAVYQELARRLVGLM